MSNKDLKMGHYVPIVKRDRIVGWKKADDISRKEKIQTFLGLVMFFVLFYLLYRVV